MKNKSSSIIAVTAILILAILIGACGIAQPQSTEAAAPDDKDAVAASNRTEFHLHALLAEQCGRNTGVHKQGHRQCRKDPL